MRGPRGSVRCGVTRCISLSLTLLRGRWWFLSKKGRERGGLACRRYFEEFRESAVLGSDDGTGAHSITVVSGGY